MKFFSLILLVILCFGSKSVTPAQQRETPLSNAAVIKLVRAGFKEKTIISIVRSRPNRFTLDPDRLIELKRNGVSENIILAMLAQDGPFEISDDDWPDNFSSERRNSKPDPRAEGGVDIFGNDEGSKGQTRSRGTRGANEAETTTTGTATVRILRPTEPGGPAAKLERTPTLNNEAVIKLVEAGFSEGTIVKRIEDSPADFDLSSARIDELRKRRVSDVVIAAMRAAMSDEPPVYTKPAKAGKK